MSICTCTFWLILSITHLHEYEYVHIDIQAYMYLETCSTAVVANHYFQLLNPVHFDVSKLSYTLHINILRHVHSSSEWGVHNPREATLLFLSTSSKGENEWQRSPWNHGKSPLYAYNEANDRSLQSVLLTEFLLELSGYLYLKKCHFSQPIFSKITKGLTYPCVNTTSFCVTPCIQIANLMFDKGGNSTSVISHHSQSV